MRKFYEKPEYVLNYGDAYVCDHPRYNVCTLFSDKEGKGIAVIQQRYDPKTKHTWWGVIDKWLASDIYINNNFKKFLKENAAFPDENGLYPTFEVRKLMWQLRMCPMKKEDWESDL